MGKKKKFNGLKDIARALRPATYVTQEPVYAFGAEIKNNKAISEKLNWPAQVVERLNDKQPYVIAKRSVRKTKNHYTELKKLITGRTEAEAIKLIDEYVARYKFTKQELDAIVQK